MAFASHQPKAGDANYEAMMKVKQDAEVQDMLKKAQEAAAALNVRVGPVCMPHTSVRSTTALQR